MTFPLLLDCTLRDGGFVNDWNFGLGSIKSIISRLDHAKVDIIEIGLIDARRNYDENRSIFPNTDSILPIMKGICKPQAMIVAMVEYGTCDIEKLSKQSKSCLDGVRVIFKKNDQDEALSYLKQLKEKGYKIFINPVSVTSYTLEEISVLINKINMIEPYAVSIVDTYGLMHSKELLDYFDKFNEQLEKDIILGYHAHNNFQMAYANSITLINKNILGRQLVIDGSLFGMGKSAGNACTELLAMYMNEFCGRNFKIHQIQEAIDVDILKEFDKKSWGYNFEYYIAALNDCHPFYIQNLLSKRTLSVKSINEILGKLRKHKKLSYDKELIEDMYNQYQCNYCDDKNVVKELKKIFSLRKILLLGPGKTLTDYVVDINNFIINNTPLVISINFLNETYPIDYVFMSNAKRYSQFFHKIYDENMRGRLICTSNITEAGKNIDYILNYSSLLSDVQVIRDNPLVMFLQLLKKIGTEEVILAGFDGYTKDNSDNYYGDYVRLLYCQEDVVLRNKAIKDEFCILSRDIRFSSLTPTKYF